MLARVLEGVASALAGATIAYLARRRRLPRMGAAILRAAKATGRLAWGNTRVLFVAAILFGYGWNAYQTQQIKRLASVDRAALCLFYSPLRDLIVTDEFKVSHPTIYGLSPIAVLNLELALRQYKAAAAVLKSLGCMP